MNEDLSEMDEMVGKVVRAESAAHKRAKMLHELDVELRELADRIEHGHDRVWPPGGVSGAVARSTAHVLEIARKVAEFDPIGEAVVEFVERLRSERIQKQSK